MIAPVAVLAFSLLSGVTLVHAQSYPTKPVSLVVTFPPGAATDTFARVAARQMSELLGQQVVVINQAGAGGITATAAAAKAAPDGYSLLWGSSGPMTISQAWGTPLPYDTVRDFAPVGVFTRIPFFMVVHPSLPVKTPRELVAFASARPGVLNYASGGIGGISHFAGELFKAIGKVQLTHVPYRGTAIFESELIAGMVEIAFVSPTVAQRNAAPRERLRVLATTGPQRSHVFPNTPTMSEGGVPGYEFTQWYGVFGPAKLPASIVSTLNGALMKSLEEPDVRKRIAAEGGSSAPNTPAQFASSLRDELDKYTKVIKAAGLEHR